MRLDAAERTSLEQAIAARAAALLDRAKVIAAYSPMGHEVDPAACLRAVNGARIALPWFENREAPMLFRVAGGALEPGPFGTMQPHDNSEAVIPEIVLVPLVAADTRCHRIGQGKGHFDRTLAALRAAAPITAIGLAWDEQIYDAVPTDNWDQRLDAVITPTRTLAE